MFYQDFKRCYAQGAEARDINISPIVMAGLASAAIYDKSLTAIQFSNHWEPIAAALGLRDALAGTFQPGSYPRSNLPISPLTKLATHSDVDICNEIVGNLLWDHLCGGGADCWLVGPIVNAIGELHDNIASRACGAGYSSAFVYRSSGGLGVSIAVVDAGCGMLKNVKRAEPLIQTDVQAIEWCLERGNTSKGQCRDDMAQRVPEDLQISPFTSKVATYAEEDHHAGEGLWRLTELIRLSQGSLWICSGDGEILVNGAVRTRMQAGRHWNGLALEMQIDVDPFRRSMHSVPPKERTELAERLGI